MKIFGREPATWVGLIGSGLAVAAAFGVPHITAGVAAAGTALLSAGVMAIFTRPVAPALGVGAFTALMTLLAEFGLHATDGQVAAVTAFILGTYSLLGVRPQVDPTTSSGRVIEGTIVRGATLPR